MASIKQTMPRPMQIRLIVDRVIAELRMMWYSVVMRCRSRSKALEYRLLNIAVLCGVGEGNCREGGNKPNQ